MTKLIMIAVGGAIGALARFGVGSWALGRLGGAVPDAQAFAVGTLVVNLVGCFAGGVLLGVLLSSGGEGGTDRAWVREYWPLLVTGFLGALTTFSAFGMDTVQMLNSGRYAMVLANVGANVVGGIGLAWFGWWIGSRLAS